MDATSDSAAKGVSTGRLISRTTATRSLALATAIVASGFLGSRLLGVVRTIAIANAFGTEPELGAYWVAFRLPDLIFQVLAGATLASAFIPTFARYIKHHGEEQAWRLASAVLNLVALATAALALLALLLAPWLVPLTAPGLTGELRSQAIELTRIMLISPVLFAISGMFMGILNARYHFLLPAVAPMLYNLSIIAGALFLSRPFGVHGLAIGVVAGSALHLLVQVPGLARIGMRYSRTLDWRDPGVREVGRLMLPRVLGLAAAQLNFVIAIFFASRQSAEAISAITYAWLLAMLPLALVGMSIATAVFPTLAEQAASDRLDEVRRTLSQSLRYILFLTLPASVGLMLLREPLIVLLLQHGAFDRAATSLTSSVLFFYAIGLSAHATTEILSRGFYALSDTRTPVAMAVLAMVLNLLFTLVLVGPLDHRGIALAISLSAIVEAAALFILLRRRLGALEDTALGASVVRVLVATVLMAEVVTLFLLGSDAAGLTASDTVRALVLLAIAVPLGVAVFALAALAIRSQEAERIRQQLPPWLLRPISRRATM